MKDFELHIGALADPLIDQCIKQELNYAIKEVDGFQKSFNAVTRLYLNGYISPSIADSTRKRIFKSLSKHIKSMNEENDEK